MIIKRNKMVHLVGKMLFFVTPFLRRAVLESQSNVDKSVRDESFAGIFPGKIKEHAVRYIDFFCCSKQKFCIL